MLTGAPEVVELVKKMLDKSPDRRPDMAGVAQVLAKVAR